jgi:hypothetical protein
MPNGWFRPGDRAPVTGIYSVTHDQHRAPHDVFAAQGDKFPQCRQCGARVNFALSQVASHIDSDKDFGNSARAEAPKERKKRSAGDS